MPSSGCALSCITPPHTLQRLLDNPNRDIREAALSTLLRQHGCGASARYARRSGLPALRQTADGRS